MLPFDKAQGRLAQHDMHLTLNTSVLTSTYTYYWLLLLFIVTVLYFVLCTLYYFLHAINLPSNQDI